MERYGKDVRSTDLVINKRKKTNLERYGFESNSMSEESKEKLRNTNLERYGVEYPIAVEEFVEKQQKNSFKIEYFNDNLYYQSSYELDFIEHVNNIGLLSELERGFFVKYNLNGDSKIHYPDFYIEKYNLIIEIKSSYYYYKYESKNIIKKKTCEKMGYNYIFIIDKDYTDFNKMILN